MNLYKTLPQLNVVLKSPIIPWNTGNAGRTCLGFGAALHLVKPLGFDPSDKQAKRAGLDLDQVIDTISKGAAGSWQMENRGRTMARDEFDFGFAVDWMRKDLGICMREAAHSGAPLPITEVVDSYYAEVQQRGGNRWDTSSLISLLRAES